MFHKTLAEALEAYNRGRFDEAFSLYKELALGGHAESQIFVGWMLLEGKGVIANSAEAAEWFKRSASLGSPRGAFYLARYLTSQGQHHEAFEWYRKAATFDYLPGIFWVGYALATGKGVNPDIIEAYKYLTRAKEQGHVYAQRQLAVLDLQGHRGFKHRLLGAISFIGAVLRGSFIGGKNPASDKLRG